jgi:hypothetical protein
MSESPNLAERYEGKPLLRLLELWVLRAIGKLSEQFEVHLVEMEPDLRQSFSRTGTWFEMLEAELELPPTMKDAVNAEWQRQTEASAEVLDPELFARTYVDRNLDF